jgi:hypothetical protein
MNLPESPVDWLLVLAVSLAGALVIGLLIRSGTPLLPKKINRIVSVLRILALITLLLALLDPFLKRSAPDPSAYRVAVLGDVSRSMQTRDLDDESSRLEWLATWLNPTSGEPGFRQVLDERTPVNVRLFSEEKQPWAINTDTPIEAIPGQTAIGDALASLLDGEGSRSGSLLGGVLLLSDGINLSGRSPVEAARAFSRSGIPVSVIGIGESTVRGDVAIRFSEDVKTLREGQEGEIQVAIKNTYDLPRSGSLSVYQNDRLLTERDISMEPEESLTESIPIQPSAPGVDTLRAVFTPGFDGDNEATNTSFSIAEIRPRDHYNFLLLAAGGGWSERMLRVLARENESLSMDSLVRIDAERYFLNKQASAGETAGNQPVQRETLDEIPANPDFYRAYDALILDSSVLVENPETFDRILSEFTGTKGGGILLIHSGSTAQNVDRPASLRNLFPARDVTAEVAAASLPLQFDGRALFADFLGGPLFSTPSPAIPAGASLGRPKELSRAAAVPVRSKSNDQPILVTHAYGAGRAAWLASDALWKWKLESARGEVRYAEFWEAILSWLAVGGKDRMVTPANATVASIDTPVDLGINLLGRDYTPRMDATVSALITAPDGQTRNIRLVPDIDEPGHYLHREPLDQIGTWRIDYAALFPDGDELQKTAWLATAATSPESKQTAFQEKMLRDIARITGGAYHSYTEWTPRSPFPLSDKIPEVEDRIHWTRTWPFLLAAFGLLAAEWWLRRRHGLR